MKKKAKNTSKFKRILSDIKSVKIQGAENIAKAGIQAFLLKEAQENPNISTKKIIETRPTEPLLQNAIKFLSKSRSPKRVSKRFLSYINLSHKKIAKYGSRLIRNNMNIFTHCHSSSVVSILKYAKIKKKKFVVYNTETFPLFQGRKTAQELAKAGIKVIHVPDSAGEFALKKCDLFLFGSDAFLKKGAVNKTGTLMFCKLAKQYNIQRYSCGISLKYAKKIKLEMRKGKEIWDERNKNIEVLNPAFDIVPRKYITGVVSEFGIFPYKKFIKKAKENLKKFF